jgi:ABC-type Zn2+ transport system substrate-binding protein/surface adhesin
MGNKMSTHNHDVESEGAKTRDHSHPRHHFWKHAHRDWRVWIAVVLMLVAIVAYVMTDSLSLRPGKRAVQPTPEAIAP